MPALTFPLVSESEFARLVDVAFKNYGSLLNLSRSPLASSPLTSPALVLDENSPTPDDYGRALESLYVGRLTILAPASPPYTLGTERPFDDPSWRDPLWWRYNLLRHWYLEPIHPDLLEGNKLSDKLIELTGIPDFEILLQERSRAVHEVALLLREQLQARSADPEITRLAIEDYLQEAPRPARFLLDLAATFRWVFPRRLLMDMATAEHMTGVDNSLGYLINHRLLITGDAGANLLIPPGLQVYLHARLPPDTLVRRHSIASRHYLGTNQPVQAVWHLQMAGRFTEAADILLSGIDALIVEGQLIEACEGLAGFAENQLSANRWVQVQITLGDIYQRLGNHPQALASLRKALKTSSDIRQRARIYRRLGKLYEDDNQLRALGYYSDAQKGFAEDDPELIDMLKDRAWLHIFRREWVEAETDLRLALEKVPESAQRQNADIYHALAGLHRRQNHYEIAIQYALQALNIREEIGDLQRLAESSSALGLIYDEMGDHAHAIPAYQEALATFKKIGDQEGIGSTYLNLGAVYFSTNRYTEAVNYYQESLEIFTSLELPRAIAQAHQNLAEAFSALNQPAEARWHWQEGFTLSQTSGLDDQVAEFRQLREQTALLQDIVENLKIPRSEEALLPIEQTALELAQQKGNVSVKMLMERGYSKPTATRHLSDLAARGLLARLGKGRAACYVLPK